MTEPMELFDGSEVAIALRVSPDIAATIDASVAMMVERGDTIRELLAWADPLRDDTVLTGSERVYAMFQIGWYVGKNAHEDVPDIPVFTPKFGLAP